MRYNGCSCVLWGLCEKSELKHQYNQYTHMRRRRGGGGAKKKSGKSSGKFGQWEIREKTIENSGKSNGKFGEKQWESRAKAIIFARNKCRRFPSFLIAFAKIFPLLLPEFPIAFA